MSWTTVSDDDEKDKNWKVKGIIDHVQIGIKKLFTMGRCMCVDEMMVL